jgi:hypothetical protein
MDNKYALDEINENIDGLKNMLFPPMKTLKIAVVHSKGEGYV